MQATIIAPSKAETAITGFMAAYVLPYKTGEFKTELHAFAPNLRYFINGTQKDWADLPMHAKKASHKSVAFLNSVIKAQAAA